ncbi:hypothetical protein B0H15DRAFT_740640, partial [Mycena belliarum]
MKSPFAQKLHTNYVPSETEAEAIKAHLIPHASEASRLQALIEDLCARRQRELDYIAAHKALVSPARRLPQDVLQEIFLACIPTARNAVMSAQEAPILLCRICSAWRTIALSIPALWASLHLPLQHVFEGTSTGPPIMWLERSGRCPLSLSIVGARTMEHFEAYESEFIDPLFDYLEGCAHRWQSIDLASEWDEGIMRLKDMYSPILVTAKIRGVLSEIVELKLLTSPSLRRVHLQITGYLDKGVADLPLRWGCLTHLILHAFVDRYPQSGLSPTMMLDILARCPRLISFTADTNNSSENSLPDSSAVAPLILRRLRELILCRCNSPVGPNSVSHILRNLIMPELRTIQLPRTGASLSGASPFLCDLATRSPLVEELHIDLASLAPASLADTIPVLHSLKRLYVLAYETNDSATVDQLLALLLPEPGGAPPCPLLAELQITDCPLTSITGDITTFAARMLDGGCNGFTRLDGSLAAGSYSQCEPLPQWILPRILLGMAFRNSLPRSSSLILIEYLGGVERCVPGTSADPESGLNAPREKIQKRAKRIYADISRLHGECELETSLRSIFRAYAAPDFSAATISALTWLYRAPIDKEFLSRMWNRGRSLLTPADRPRERNIMDHLHTNYVPREIEAEAIQSQLIPHVLEASRLQALIQDLCARRQRELDYIAAHQALISPARRLPQDVLQEIFLACLPTTRNAVMSAREVPLLLCRICSAWRAIALSIPALWASLHIPLQHVFEGISTEPPIMWLERSGRCPLSLSLVGARTMEHFERFDSEFIDPFFDYLEGCAHRWRSIDLEFTRTDGMLRLKDMYSPILVTAKIQAVLRDIKEIKLLTSPSLRRVRLHIPGYLDKGIADLPLRWGCLTHLILHGFVKGYPQSGLSPKMALDILARCPRLI